MENNKHIIESSYLSDETSCYIYIYIYIYIYLCVYVCVYVCIHSQQYKIH